MYWCDSFPDQAEQYFLKNLFFVLKRLAATSFSHKYLSKIVKNLSIIAWPVIFSFFNPLKYTHNYLKKLIFLSLLADFPNIWLYSCIV
jgi:hypothetical protein